MIIDHVPNLIVMLTHNDFTVKSAHRIFDECKNAKAMFWGLKDCGLPIDEMKELYSFMKKCGKTTVLEIVEYSEDKCIEGAQKALACRCDILMGTVFFDSVNEFCRKHNLKYMPFIGNVFGRPSILEGEIFQMIDNANKLIKKGVYGFGRL